MKLADLLEQLQRHLMHLWMDRDSGGGLTYSEFEYLRTVESLCREKSGSDVRHNQHLQSVVGARRVRKASASAMVVKLERRGLVKRLPCRYDSRAQHILLTRKGAKLLRDSGRLYHQLADRIKSRLNAAEHRALARALAKISDDI